jgi:two-component sensor histidine kinase
MIMNELITNSLKYAFPEGEAGSIQIDLRVTEEVVLSVTDNGRGGARVGSEGIGSRVVSLLAQQLGGTIEVDDLGPGSRVVLRMPKPTI